MRVLVIIILTSLYLPLCAQKALTGRVVDAVTEEPLTGANIYLLADFGTGTISNVNGDFDITIPKHYMQDTLLVSFVGYQEHVMPLSEWVPTIRLQPKGQEMAAVSISAEPLIAEEFKVSKINKLEIYTNPAAKADPLLAVNSLPASTTTDESAAVSLRGSGPLETGIFLNNVPVYNAMKYSQLNGIGTFSVFNTALIQNVTVFPGNPPLEFGNTTSGVVSIKTDEQPVDKNTNSVIVSPANIGYQRNQRAGAFGLRVFSNYQPSYAIKLLNRKALERIKSFESLDLGMYLFGPVSKRVTVRSYIYGLAERYAYNFIHPTFHGDFDQRKRRAFNVTNLSVKTGLGTLDWNQGYSWSQADYVYSASDFSVNNRSFFQGVNWYWKSENIHLKSGLSWDYRSSDVEGHFFTYDYALAEDHPVQDVQDDVSSAIFEAFAYGKYYIAERWIIGAGLRKSLRSRKKDYLSKQVNLTWLAGNHWKLIGGLGEYYKSGIDDNQGLLIWIKSRQASLDLFYDRHQTEATLSLFSKSNEWDDIPYNVNGVEIFIDQTIAEKWTGDVSYTFLTSESDGKTGQYDIGYFLKANLRYKPSNYWTITANTLYREGVIYKRINHAVFDPSLKVFQPFYTKGFGRYPDYFTLNLAVNRLFPISEKLMLVAFASMNNVTDHENVRNYRYDFDYSDREAELFSRRMYYFGIQVNF